MRFSVEWTLNVHASIIPFGHADSSISPRCLRVSGMPAGAEQTINGKKEIHENDDADDVVASGTHAPRTYLHDCKIYGFHLRHKFANA